MAFFDGYSVDQLNRVLSASRWVLGSLEVFTAAAGVFNQWIAERVADLQRADKSKAQERLSVSESELEATKAKTAEVAARLARVTEPRNLTAEQSRTLKALLPAGPRGKVVLTFLSVERDAERYMRQIGALLAECGFEVTYSDHLWFQLAFDSVYVCARKEGAVPAQGAHIQNCFREAGIRVKGFYDEKFVDGLGVPQDGVVFVVSSREWSEK